MSYISAIVLAAGKGERFKSRISKPLFYINAKPLIVYSLAALARNRRIREIIVVANRSNQKELLRKIKQHRISKVSKVVLGGLRRQDSVQNGLKQVSAQADTVLIHDGARPFIDQKILDRVIKEALLSGAAIVGVPVKATIKQVITKPSSRRKVGIPIERKRASGHQVTSLPIKKGERSIQGSVLFSLSAESKSA